MSKHILIVEDNTFTRELFVDILHAFKFKTTVLRTGQQVIDYFDDGINERPDLLLLDINLPEKNGVYVLQYLRGKLKLDNLKILVITANHIAGQMPEMNLADIVMTKPFLPNMLKEKIDFLLNDQVQESEVPQPTIESAKTQETPSSGTTPDVDVKADPDVTMEAPIVQLIPDDDDDATTEATTVDTHTDTMPPLLESSTTKTANESRAS